MLALLLLKNPITGDPGPLLQDIFAGFDDSEMAPEQRQTVERLMMGSLGYLTSLTVPIAAVVTVFVVWLVLLIEIRLLRAFDPPVPASRSTRHASSGSDSWRSLRTRR